MNKNYGFILSNSVYMRKENNDTECTLSLFYTYTKYEQKEKYFRISNFIFYTLSLANTNASFMFH